MLSIFCGLRLNYSARMHSHKAFEHVQVASVLLPEVFAVDFFMSSACPMWHSKLANAVFNISADQGCAFDFCCMFGLTVAWYLGCSMPLAWVLAADSDASSAASECRN